MRHRNDLRQGKWQILTRTGDYGKERLYLTIFHRPGDIVTPKTGDTPTIIGSALCQPESTTETTEGEPLLETPESLERLLPTVGDLVVVKADLQFISAGNNFPNHYMLPDNLRELFKMRDLVNQNPKMPHETKFIPTLTLNCYLDIDGMLELTAYDYEESMTDTKRWDMREHGGLRLRDYVTKRSKLFGGNGESISLRDDNVDFYTIAWKPEDMLTVIPGVVETRRQKHWFFNNWNNNIYKSASDLTSETYVKFPLVGMVGTLLDFRVVTHGMTPDGQYVEGSDHKTIFYKIWFNGRIPVWVDAPVWKCPDPLILPILLAIP